jgi:LysR family nitrogen assimilation transcriptional regulator
MDEGQLRAFLKIGDFHSITKAADDLGIAQPSLSQQLLRLEDELGAKLFHRTSRGVSLTSAGVTFKAYAESILLSTRQAREEVRRSTKGPIGEVSIGLQVSIGEQIGPAILRTAHREMPGVKVNLRLAFASDLVHWLEEGSLNTALTYFSNEIAYLHSEHVADEALLLVGPPAAFGQTDARGIAIKPISVERLRDFDLLLPPMSRSLKRRINRQHHGDAIHLSVRGQVDSLQVLKSMLLDGTTHSLLPYMAVHEELRAGWLSAAQIAGMNVALPLSLVRAGRRVPEVLPAVEQLIRQELRQLLSRIGSPVSEREALTALQAA